MKKTMKLIVLYLLMATAALTAREQISELWKTAPEKREPILKTFQSAADELSADAYREYLKGSPENAEKGEEKSLTLRFYNAAFDRILEDLKTVRVQPGTMMIWHLYNMGYIVKTPTRCFGMDINHRRAAELAPYLDFLLISHSHGDHQWKPLLEKMAELKKPVISNFIKNHYQMTDSGQMQLGDISIRSSQVDHNKTLLKFVNIYEIDCGEETGNCVLLHTGDACNPAQFEVENKVDIFIPHIRVGMNIEDASRNYVKPNYILMSHVLELGHKVDKWRWSYRNGLDDSRKVKSCPNVTMPVWGDKFIWNGNNKTLQAL